MKGSLSITYGKNKYLATLKSMDLAKARRQAVDVSEALIGKRNKMKSVGVLMQDEEGKALYWFDIVFKLREVHITTKKYEETGVKIEVEKRV